MRELINAVRRDHSDFRNVLEALRALTAESSDAPSLYGTARLRSILNYFQVYLDRYHHPKEERLFAALGKLDQGLRPLLGQFESQHVRSATLLDDLGGALSRYEGRVEGGRGTLQEIAHAYAEFHLAHMRDEENLWRALTRQELGALDRLALRDARQRDGPPFWWANMEAGFAAFAHHIGNTIR